jgi:glycogen synthase
MQVGYAVPGFSHEGTAADHSQNVQQLLAVVQQALQQRCMALDVSWDKPAAEWESLLVQVADQQQRRRAAQQQQPRQH